MAIYLRGLMMADRHAESFCYKYGRYAAAQEGVPYGADNNIL